MILVQIGLFWLVTVFISQSHHINWKDFFIWVVFAHVVGYGLMHLLPNILPIYLAILFSLLAIIGILFLVLEYKIGISNVRERIKIIIVYFVASFVIQLGISTYSRYMSEQINKAIEKEINSEDS